MSHVCTFFLGGNFFFKVSTLPKPLAADLVPWQLCAAHRACEQLVRQCLGFPTRSNDDSTSPSRHHDITTLLLALKLRQNWAAASRLVVGGGWVDRVGIFSWIVFGDQSMAVRHPFYKTRLCNNFVMTLVSTVFSLSRFHGPKWKVLKVGLKPPGPTRRLLTWRQMCPGGRISRSSSWRHIIFPASLHRSMLMDPESCEDQQYHLVSSLDR